MTYFSVEICRICGKFYRVYHDEIRGDPTVCKECEKKSGGDNKPEEGKDEKMYSRKL